MNPIIETAQKPVASAVAVRLASDGSSQERAPLSVVAGLLTTVSLASSSGAPKLVSAGQWGRGAVRSQISAIEARSRSNDPADPRSSIARGSASANTLPALELVSSHSRPP